MGSPEESPKLRMAPRESPEELAHRYAREQRAASLQREDRLENSLHPFRAGSVPYLNAVPLTRGLESEVTYAVPARLAEMLRKDELEAALVSVTEVLFTDRYDILDGIGVCSLGEVQSVFLAHRGPIEAAREIFCDPASLTSVHLLKTLLAEQGLRPEFKELAGKGLPRRSALAKEGEAYPDYFLLIGDAALDFLRAPHDHEIWDLGAAWYELTKLPFVYAAWALRRGVENQTLCRILREAKDFGMDTLDSIINSREEYDLAFRRDYLGWHIHYHLGSDEKRGLAKFAQLLRKHSGRDVFDPRFV